MYAGNQEGWISGIPKAGSPAWHQQEEKAVSTPARALPGPKQQQASAAGSSKVAYDSQSANVPTDLENLRVDASIANAVMQQQQAAGSQAHGTEAEQQMMTVTTRKTWLLCACHELHVCTLNAVSTSSSTCRAYAIKSHNVDNSKSAAMHCCTDNSTTCCNRLLAHPLILALFSMPAGRLTFNQWPPPYILPQQLPRR
jgi:hypothetical protein